MSKTTSGWTIFILALGMMCGLLSSDVAKLASWDEAAKPQFVAIFMAHFGTVVLAFIGGKLIPTDRLKSGRAGDLKLSEATDID